MKKKTNPLGIAGGLLAVLCITLALAACPTTDDPEDSQPWFEEAFDVVYRDLTTYMDPDPDKEFKHDLSTYKIEPSGATNRTVVWEIDSFDPPAGAYNWVWLEGKNTLCTGHGFPSGTEGKVYLTATIYNGRGNTGDPQKDDLVQDVVITVKEFSPVADIEMDTDSMTATTSITLRPVVKPDGASLRNNVSWSIKNAGGTGATLDGNILKTAMLGSGEVTVTATIPNGKGFGVDFIKDFPITVNQLIPVLRIDNVPGTAIPTKGLALNGDVMPIGATNKAITWSIVPTGTTSSGASITDGRILNTRSGGTVVVRATVANGNFNSGNGNPIAYTQDFSIDVNAFIPATGITLEKVSENAEATKPLTLYSIVTPDNATNRDIVWSITVQGGTEAVIVGNVLTAQKSGTVTIQARITNGSGTNSDTTRSFDIPVSGLVAVTAIADVPSTVTVGNAFPLTLTGRVVPPDATNQSITWAIKSAGSTGASLNSGILRASSAGTIVVTATIINGKGFNDHFTDDFTITAAAAGNIGFTITAETITDKAGSIASDISFSRANPTWGTIAVTGYDAGSLRWSVPGTDVKGTTQPIDLNPGRSAYDSEGRHFLTIFVTIGGVPYSKSVIFTVGP